MHNYKYKYMYNALVKNAAEGRKNDEDYIFYNYNIGVSNDCLRVFYYSKI